jgi:ATP-dependent Zn protease
VTAEERRRRRLEATAYHEAGHAVVSVLLGRACKHVTIVPDETQDSLGHLRAEKPLGDPLATLNNPLPETAEAFAAAMRGARLYEANLGRMYRRWRSDIAINLAGVRAERRLIGRRNNIGASSDYRRAVDIAYLIVDFFPGEWFSEREKRERAKKPRTVKFAGRAVALDLWDNIAQAIIKTEGERAELLLDENWKAVERVGQALLRRKTISGRYVRRLVREATTTE